MMRNPKYPFWLASIDIGSFGNSTSTSYVNSHIMHISMIGREHGHRLGYLKIHERLVVVNYLTPCL